MEYCNRPVMILKIHLSFHYYKLNPERWYIARPTARASSHEFFVRSPRQWLSKERMLHHQSSHHYGMASLCVWAMSAITQAFTSHHTKQRNVGGFHNYRPLIKYLSNFDILTLKNLAPMLVECQQLELLKFPNFPLILDEGARGGWTSSEDWLPYQTCGTTSIEWTPICDPGSC